MKKMLIALDGSEGSMKAVDYVGRQFSCMDDLEITLLHVLPYPPAPFWDDGHIPSKAEKQERDRAIENWTKGQRARFGHVFSEAVDKLTRRGFSPEQIRTRTISDSIDVAGSILEDAKDGEYETLVLGRRGLSAAERFLIGSVTKKIINHASGIAVCVVE